VPNARLATVLGVLAALLVLVGVWSRGPATTIEGRVTRIERGNGLSGGRVWVGDASVQQDQVGRLHLGDQVTLTDQGSGAGSMVLLVTGVVCALAALANGLRARWMGEAVAIGWAAADVRPIDVAVRGRVRTLAWVDGTLADTLGVRRVRADLGPTARVAGDPTTGRFVLDDGHHLLPMKPVRRG
jgi:hypothetical protein